MFFLQAYLQAYCLNSNLPQLESIREQCQRNSDVAEPTYDSVLIQVLPEEHRRHC